MISQTKEKSTGCGEHKNISVSKDISEDNKITGTCSWKKIIKSYAVMHLKINNSIRFSIHFSNRLITLKKMREITEH